MDCAIRLMLDWFTLRGILQAEIDIKVFGGSDMFSATGGEPRMPTVGRQNIEKTMDIIESKGLRLLASDLGGMRGRKIFFSTHTGEVLLKKMNRSQFKE
jgi:chemotaxis protein CheD